jgi:xanthine/uracil permease
MTTLIKKYYLTLIGVLIGAIAGYLYWQQIGCLSGSCAITSSPVNSTAYVALMGGLLLNTFKKDDK